MLEELVSDLALSGLTPDDIRAREPGPAEMAAIGVAPSALARNPGYIIPYFDIGGAPTQFYRLKMMNCKPKYRQVKDTPNHVYFPPNFQKSLNGHKYVIVTEGEKKAAAATKAGFPAVALGGADSWRHRTIILPNDTELTRISTKGGGIKAKIPSGLEDPLYVEERSILAQGMQALIDEALSKQLIIIIIFDSDSAGLAKFNVQRAAARLGYELRYRGLPITQIRQLVLPLNGGAKKEALDDFLAAKGPDIFGQLLKGILEQETAFPRHPDPRGYLNSKLQQGRLSRKESQDLALAVLSELDANGSRLKTEDTGDPFYFDGDSHVLMPVNLLRTRESPLHEQPFGAFLYRKFGLSSADSRVIQWLAAQYTGEDGINPAKTHKVLAQPSGLPNTIAYQTSNSQFALVSPDPKHPIRIFNNGSCGLLFEQDQVKPLDSEELTDRFHDYLKGTPDMLWLDVMKTMNFKEETHNRLLAALLCYMSPWLLRWRGTQLPFEMVIGEAGSGKSSLYGLRQEILVGMPSLSNLTTDIKDWYAGITNVGGLHVLDNVHFTGAHKDYRQRLSDEICRIITEPDPHIELRQLYTTSKVVRLPVRSTFAITAIEQPFYNSDLVQRAMIFSLGAIGGEHNSYWNAQQLDRADGRVGWIAHHLAVLHKFLHIATSGGWSTSFKATHRLANYEQCLGIMCQVFGLDSGWLANTLFQETLENVSEADWAVQGISDYVDFIRIGRTDVEEFYFSAGDIADWASSHEVYYANGQLINARRLGRYISSHAKMLENATGMIEGPKRNNKRMYYIKPK